MSAELLEKFADRLVPQLEEFVKSAVKLSSANLLKKIEELESKLVSLPVPKDGDRGEKGLPGENGKDGEKGEPGIQGPPGEKGADGINGKDGVDGKDGIDGKDGRDGIDGKDGAPGNDGINGKDGADGKPGETAYEIALKGGFRGDERAWLNSLVGEPGRDGRDGRDAKGEPGERGMDGKDGMDIDDIKCIESDDEGNLSLVFERGERRKSIPFRVPGHVFRGVFKSEVVYSRGNTVTAGGSMFVALKDNPQGTPGNSDDWQLAVKRGRDGDRPTQVRQRDPNTPYKIGGSA